METPGQPDASSQSLQRRAMGLSLGIAILLLGAKSYAYISTGSAAILSDAAESVVHLAAIGFAAWSLRLSFRPSDASHLYGHEKIHFFSAGFEGGMISVAGIYIIYAAVEKWIAGEQAENIGLGAAVTAVAGGINGLLGWHLVRTGRRQQSLILVANGKHIITDLVSSVGVAGGLLLAKWTAIWQLDPAVAIAIALNILWTGGKLMRESIGGLMDEADPAVTEAIRAHLERRTRELGIEFHALRQRKSGEKIWVEFHLLFKGTVSVREAHRLATELENEIEGKFPNAVEVLTHLESREDHDQMHPHERE